MLKDFTVDKFQICFISDKNNRHFKTCINLQTTLIDNITKADSVTKLTNADTVATVTLFAITTNTPVITFATRLLMFTGCYSQVNVPEMLQSADVSCPAYNASVV